VKEGRREVKNEGACVKKEQHSYEKREENLASWSLEKKREKKNGQRPQCFKGGQSIGLGTLESSVCDVYVWAYVYLCISFSR
jgi:hypothetical protein